VAAIPECDFIILAADPRRLLDFSECFRSANVTFVAMAPAAAPIRLLWQLPHLAREHRMDLIHTQYITPPFSPCATAVTVHDILFESHPEYFERLFVLRSRLLVRRAARRSLGVFTVSDFSRRQIAETFRIVPEKIHVIPNGVDRARFFPGSEGSEVAENLGLEPGRYFLTVGRLEPRKNHANLLRAWARLGRPRPRLTIVGQPHFRYSESLDLIHTLDLDRDVVVLEAISDRQLPAIYRNARAFVYCSWAEGFGMPVLEAMASGIPVISSATTALTEICADAALLVGPGDVDEISNAVLQLDQKLDLRQNLILRGLRRVRQYDWQNAVDVVRNAYLGYFGLTMNESLFQVNKCLEKGVGSVLADHR